MPGLTMDVKNILLVGGLGGSPYLYNQLNGQHQNVLQPERAYESPQLLLVEALMHQTGC